MSEVTYEQVSAILASSSVDKDTVYCQFKCPVSGTVVEASASLRSTAADSTSGKVKERAKSTLFSSLRRSLVSAVRSVTGGGLAGRIASDAANEATRDVGKGKTFTEEDQQRGVVDAFKSVQSSFAWDADKKQFVATESAGSLASAFKKRLQENPISSKFDTEILSRLMIDVANADGNMAEEEKQFLGGFIDGSIEALQAKGAVSAAEFEGVESKDVSANILMLCWAVALSDEDLDDAEQERLDAIAGNFSLEDAAAQQARSDAASYLFEQALDAAYLGPDASQELQGEAMGLAKRLGIADDEAARLDVAYRKRM